MNKLTNKENRLLIVILAIAGVLLVLGWRLFYFETDDAYIAFRYIANSQLGFGYVWNAPPFRPVEGYTSLLWVMLLDLIWRLFNLQPPQVANLLSLGFAFGSLLLTARLVLSLNWPDHLKPARLLFTAFALAGVLSNRTFLTWSSGGLETAMFNFFFLLWVTIAFAEPSMTAKWLLQLAVSAALLYFSRPDGMLMVAATLFFGFLMLLERVRARGRVVPVILSLLPLLVIPVHLLWRKSFYGEWLPNTYYAKSMPGRIWPEAGLRYLGSFMIEYGLLPWILLLLLVIGAFWLGRKIGTRRMLLLDINPFEYLTRPAATTTELSHQPLLGIGIGWPLLAGLAASVIFYFAGRPFVAAVLFLFTSYPLLIFALYQRSLIQAVAVTAVLGQIVYYTLLIGGDHFEFRVYSNLVPLIWVVLTWAVIQLAKTRRTAIALVVFCLIFALPVQWLHWQYTHNLNTRAETRYLKMRVSEKLLYDTKALPGPIFEYLKLYDDMQDWLISHGDCVRHQEHKVFFKGVSEEVMPPRAEGALISNEGYPVITAGTVGLTAWHLPYINVLDYFGLNDYVIARNRVKFEEIPLAHERIPPLGYLGCFDPNVEIKDRRAIVIPRAVPLTAEQIIACENYYAGIYRNP